MASFYEEHLRKNILVDEDENRMSRTNIDKWIFRLFLLLIGFMPLVVIGHIKEVVSPLISTTEILSSGIKGDVFTHYKSLLLLTITVISVILFLAKIFFMDGTLKKTILNYFLGIFAGVIIISTIFSPNITIALTGLHDRSDGAVSWLCYLTLMFIAININYPKKAIQTIVYAFSPLIIINLFLTTMSFLGKDLIQVGWIQNGISIFLPEGVSPGEGSFLLGTLNHGNYLSGMFAIITVMSLTAAILNKDTIHKITFSVMSLLTVLIVFMSLSTSGFVTMICIMPFFLWLLIKLDKKIFSTIIFLIFIAFSTISIHTLATHNSKVWDETFGFFVNSNPYGEVKNVPVSINNNAINSTILGSKVYASDSSFKLPVIPETGVGGGSGRLYIWGYVFDLVQERPLLGYGLDSLMYNFPHNNIDARANLETENVIVDKPHNMYFGVLYGTGILGFIAFMGIILLALFESLKEIFKYKNENENIAILGIALLAFLFQAMFNDTLAGVAGPLWITAGVLMALILEKKNKLSY